MNQDNRPCVEPDVLLVRFDQLEAARKLSQSTETEAKPLTVADLIRALSKLPPDMELWHYGVYGGAPMFLAYLTRLTYFETYPDGRHNGAIFVQHPGRQYDVCDPHAVDEPRLCFSDSGSCEDGDPLDFGE